MIKLENSLSIYEVRQDIARSSFGSQSKEEITNLLIDYILTHAKFFIALDSKFLLRQTKLDFSRGKQKFLMVDIKEIKFLKVHSKHIHFAINESTELISISLPSVDYIPSGLYSSTRSAAKDIRPLMDEYDKRQKTYQHNLEQTNKDIVKLLTATAGIMDSYPEDFV